MKEIFVTEKDVIGNHKKENIVVIITQEDLMTSVNTNGN